MDNQDHRKHHTPGHDGHGVHVCHKCGWPFPNPHPSAKHRRSHKKICGTIEGYKVVQSEGSTHSTVNDDDEQQSDEDLKTPSPRILERSSSEKGSGTIGDKSGRSEDEVFSDAVAEFPDSGSGKGIEESPDDVKKPATCGSGKGTEESLDDVKKPATLAATFPDSDTITTLSYADAAITDVFLPPSKEAQGSSLPGCEENSQNHNSSAAFDFKERSLSGYRTEESMYQSSDDRGSTFDLNPIQPETCTDILPRNHEKTAGQIVVDAKGIKETHTKKNTFTDDFIKMDTKAFENTNINKQLLDVEVSPSDGLGKASEAVSVLVKAEGKTLESVQDAGGVEQCNDKLDSNISVSGLSPRTESVEHIDCSVHTQIKMNSVQEASVGSSGNKTSSGEERGSENVHIFSVPGYIPVVKNVEAMIQGFKDIKGGRLPQLVNVGPLEQRSEVKESVSMDSASNICPDQSNECVEISVSDIHASEDILGRAGENNELIVQKFPDETEHDISQVKVIINESQITEEFDATTYVSASEIEKTCTIHCHEEQLSDGKSSSRSFSLEHAMEVLNDRNAVDPPSDVEVGLKTNFVGVDDASDVETSEAKKHDVAENEADKGIKEESCIKNLTATSDEGKVGKYCAAGNETGTADSTVGSLDEHCLFKTTVPESANDLRENNVTLEHAVNASEKNLLAPKVRRLDSDNQEGVEELESNGNEKVQVDSAANVSAGVESDTVVGGGELQKSLATVGDVKLLQNLSDKIDNVRVMQSSDENVAKEPHLSPLGTSSSIQNNATVTDNPAGDSVAIATDNQSESFYAEGENRFDTHQLVTSATDLSVDSSSQTDSLEGQWGSVSVLSTQSDMPVIVDAEPVVSKASAEADKSDLKNPGGQHAEKSDIFEPPSFMTLVEPRGGDKATASEIQTGQNMQQPKAASLQAGWFPSLTNVVNESQGRKKNQEIIAKVTNWSTGKQQHTPLKNLLGEANTENKSKMPHVKESPMPVVQKDETNNSVKDQGSSPIVVNSAVDTKIPVAGPVKKEAGKEWNSPARYPADIKREKRKVKGRAYWAQFMCCSSVN